MKFTSREVALDYWLKQHTEIVDWYVGGYINYLMGRPRPRPEDWSVLRDKDFGHWVMGWDDAQGDWSDE